MTNDFRRPFGSASRRAVLRAGVLSAFGLDLAALWRLRAAAGTARGVANAHSLDACIVIWLAGGASHIDTFDPKPDAASDVRGELRPIATAVPGVQVSELFPRIAANLDRICLVRSLTSPEADHDRASHYMMTGFRPSPVQVYPSVGSVINALHERGESSLLPSYVAVPDSPPFGTSGYLTAAMDPFATNADPNAPNFRVRDLTPPDRASLARLSRRHGMVQALDRFAREVPATAATAGRDRFTERAFDLLTSSRAQAAFSLDHEAPETRDRYGRTTLGQSCLLARRLVERGVSFVTINDQGTGQLAWDTHAQNFGRLRDQLAPPLDIGLSALITDLAARGMLERTLVLVMGDFGRTPRINPQAGRDHHSRASSLLIAGGPVRGGTVVGATDAEADAPTHRPVTPADLAATVFALLGIDLDTQLLTPDQQPIRIVDQGSVIPELIG